MTTFIIKNTEFEPVLSSSLRLRISDWPASVTASEINCLSGVTSNIQTQIDSKISSVALDDITDWPADVTATEVGYLDGVTSDIQTQLDGKPNSDPTGVAGADAITNMMSLSQAEYDVIGAPSTSTLYIINE